MTLEEARAFALSLPEAVEQPHHEDSSFRVDGKIFATVPDADHLNVMVAEVDAHAAVSHEPGACALVPWGQRVAGVRVALAAASDAHVKQLLSDAWRRRAPKRLTAP